MNEDEYEADELRRAVWLATRGLTAEEIARDLRPHTPTSVYQALVGMAGDEPDSSAPMRQVARELDSEPRFDGWREDILRRRVPV